MSVTFIDPTQARQSHVFLTCKNHPELRWFTKNIDCIGARSIFYSSWELGVECSCPISDLVVIPYEDRFPHEKDTEA